jgi:hypothetical protein
VKAKNKQLFSFQQDMKSVYQQMLIEKALLLERNRALI